MSPLNPYFCHKNPLRQQCVFLTPELKPDDQGDHRDISAFFCVSVDEWRQQFIAQIIIISHHEVLVKLVVMGK